MFAKIVLWIAGISFIGFGLWALLAPASLAGLVHFELLDEIATTEMRAFYGGLDLGLGVYLIMGAIKPEMTRACLVAGAVLLGCIALARICGLLIDGSGSGVMYFALSTEIGGALACWLALRA